MVFRNRKVFSTVFIYMRIIRYSCDADILFSILYIIYSVYGIYLIPFVN